MDTNVPYMPTVRNVPRILDTIQRAGVPEVFNRDFLKDLGFTSSTDRSFIPLLKFLGFLDSSGRPQTSYRQFMDHTKARAVLAERLQTAYDDLFLADRNADAKPANALKGWFKTKTGAGEAVAEKMASTFKALTQYADFSAVPPQAETADFAPEAAEPDLNGAVAPTRNGANAGVLHPFGLVYRFEIHLPDTQNVDTFRAIFRALREELMS